MENSAYTDLTRSLILDVTEDELSYYETDTSVDGSMKRNKSMDEYLETPKQRFLLLVSFTAVTFHLAAICFFPSVWTMINVIIVPLIAYAIIKYERDIVHDTTTISESVKELKEDRRLLKKENKVLRETSSKLEDKAKDVKKNETNLQRKLLGQNMDSRGYIDLVRDNRLAVKTLNRSIWDLACNAILNLIMEADLNHNDSIEGSEIDMLVFEMNNLEYLEINEYRLRNFMAVYHGDVYKMMSQLKSIVKVQQHNNQDYIAIITIKREAFLKIMTSRKNIGSKTAFMSRSLGQSKIIPRGGSDDLAIMKGNSFGTKGDISGMNNFDTFDDVPK